jgi:hypothetical protein
MKKAFFILLILSTFNLSAQNYDLIVKTNEDSIACRIDSITDTRVYFEMKYNDNWIHTDIDKSAILEYKYDAINKKQVIFKPETSFIIKITEPLDFTDKRIYAGRYLFAPSAFGIDKGVNSYTNYDIFLQDIQFGLSDRFSLGVGTTIFFIPLYFMPTYTYQINDKSAFAVGDLLMFSPYSDLSFFGNLFYGMYTRGSMDNNFSVGVGLWTTTNNSMTQKTVSPAFNISAQLQISENVYFITENYWFQMNIEESAHYEYQIDDPSCDECYWIEFIEEHFNQRETIVGGLSGFRYIGKKYTRNSWQFGLVYIFFIHDNEIPNKYKQPEWTTFDNDMNYIFLPIISYSRKF